MLKDLGINKDQLKRWEDPDAIIKPIYISAIADYLDTTPEYLLGKTDKKEKPAIVGEPISDNESFILYNSLSPELRKQADEYLRFLAAKNKETQESG